MNAALDPAVSRFTVRQKDDEQETELWRGKVQAFRNLYGFLSQVIPYQDSELEELYVFLRHLAAKDLSRYRTVMPHNSTVPPRLAAVVNPRDKFELVFKNLLEQLFVEPKREERYVTCVPLVPVKAAAGGLRRSAAHR